jgi:diketogulonate reductase-like aldo/keto reductase
MDVSQIIFRFALDIGIMPITGTSNIKHMQTDLDIFDFRLNVEDIEVIEAIGKH